MKKIIMLIFIVSAAFSACSKTQMDEESYNILREQIFENIAVKGIEHKLTADEKKKILSEDLKKYKINFDLFCNYMQNNHSEDYKYIFEK
ncbi:MAG: hypothetical protein KAZ87_09630 [Spirochaetes bacterium]|nr:hypothetical protein [Spirochaetota bacterium]